MSRFCSNRWQPSAYGCECDGELTCEYTHCNVRDMIDIELARRSVEPTTSPSTSFPTGSPSTPFPSISPSTHFPSFSPVEPTRAPTINDDPIRDVPVHLAYSADHPTWRQFCGRDFDHSIQQCSVETHCLNDSSCSHNQRCYKGLPPHCNTYDMLFHTSPGGPIPTQSPAQRPHVSTASPTREPLRTEGAVYLDGATIKAEDNYWCGATQIAANKNCGTTNFYCVKGLCPFGWSCHHVENQLCGEDSAAQTNQPFVETNRSSKEPSKRPVSAPPTTSSATQSPFSAASPDPREIPQNDEDSGSMEPLPGNENKAHESMDEGYQPKPFTHVESRPELSEESEPQSSANKVLASNKAKGKRPSSCEEGWHTTSDCKSYWECDAYGKKSKSFVSCK